MTLWKNSLKSRYESILIKNKKGLKSILVVRFLAKFQGKFGIDKWEKKCYNYVTEKFFNCDKVVFWHSLNYKQFYCLSIAAKPQMSFLYNFIGKCKVCFTFLTFTKCQLYICTLGPLYHSRILLMENFKQPIFNFCRRIGKKFLSNIGVSSKQILFLKNFSIKFYYFL